MDKEQFIKLLEDHDWWYSMSDDMRKWNAGLKEITEIEKLCKGNEEFTKLYEEKRDQIFQNVKK